VKRLDELEEQLINLEKRLGELGAEGFEHGGPDADPSAPQTPSSPMTPIAGGGIA
jgi:hypothetical protein